MTTKSETTCFPNNLPATAKYNDTYITVENVEFYQNLVDYSHNLFAVITIDVSELDETQIHWLRESDLDVSVYLTNEKNEYDFSSMPNLGSLLIKDQQKSYFVLTSSFLKENRYDFAGSEAAIIVTVTQEETYDHVSSDNKHYDLNKKESVHYTTTVPDNIPEAETIPNPLYKYVGEWLYDKAGAFQ